MDTLETAGVVAVVELDADAPPVRWWLAVEPGVLRAVVDPVPDVVVVLVEVVVVGDETATGGSAARTTVPPTARLPVVAPPKTTI
ncbi:MAG TPA: hypothetical protein VFN60_01515, partial [Acidimicrobiales bacterium]|nr:hypothetical protein [Acidimicrobiales bacterium]